MWDCASGGQWDAHGPDKTIERSWLPTTGELPLSAGTEVAQSRAETFTGASWRLLTPVSWVLIVLASLTLGARGVRAQTFLEQFSYDGLAFKGVGIEVGPVWSDRLTRELSLAVRVDYGLIAPRIRLLLGASYFKGELNESETAKFEQGIRRAISDPTGDVVVDVGQIAWTNFETNFDLQYLIPAGVDFLFYGGVGIGVHVRNGSGDVIDGSFVEDALDTIVAGGTVSAGFEWAAVNNISFTMDLRGVATSELRLVSARTGLMFRFGQAGGSP